jgi:DNA-binding transcriptional MerR regulator
VKFDNVIEELGLNRNKALYWRASLKKKGLLDYGIKGLKDRYSKEELSLFYKIKDFTDQGLTVNQAISMIKDNVTPKDYETTLVAQKKQLEQANRQIELLQRKVIQLRKPFWTRIKSWFGGVWAALLGKAEA